jgi:L-aminopeptidase/D-esterase-like protein
VVVFVACVVSECAAAHPETTRAAMCNLVRQDIQSEKPMSPAITDVPGVLVGHAQDLDALTGCTVVLTAEGATGGVDVRGGAPGTRETDLLAPTAMVSVVHAIALCGGSAFGLAAATGVVEWLRERGLGFDAGVAKVPIVPAAVIFDLAIGRADRWADAAMGYAACAAAAATVAEGCAGAGAGATVGKLLGPAGAVKSGVGTWSETLADGTTIGALPVCNAWGDIYRQSDGQIIAGTRDPQSGYVVGSMSLVRQPAYQAAVQAKAAAQNTTLAVIATDARLSKAEATKLAQMAQDGLARAIRPVHTPFDGDTVFALATGQRTGPALAILGAIAADILAQAIERSVLEATSLGGLPAARDLVGRG